MCINIVAVCPWCGAETDEYTLVRLCDTKSREFRFTELSPLENIIHISSQRQARGDPVHDCGPHGRITIRSVFESATCCRDPMCSFHPPIGLQSPTLLQFLAEAAETFSGFPGFTNPWTRSDEDILLCSALNMMSDLDSARAWLAAQRSYETATGVQPQPSHYHDNSDENMIVDANQVHRYQTDTTAKNDGPLDICQEQDNLLQPNQTSRQQGQQGAQQEQEQVGTSAKKSSRAWTTEEIEALRENMNKHEWTYAKMSVSSPIPIDCTFAAVTRFVHLWRLQRNQCHTTPPRGLSFMITEQLLVTHY